MLLAIDVGNTNTVFAVYEGEQQRGLWRSSTASERTADEYGAWLLQMMALNGLAPASVQAAIISTVVPATRFNLMRLCQTYFQCEPMVVGDPSLDLGMTVRVRNPAEVGADRLVNAVAAHRAYGGPLIVIDFGTATTFDVVDRRGDYVGGIIAPGAQLSLRSLHAAAAKLPLVEIRRPQAAIGIDTVSAMQSGIYWGYIAMIEGLVARVRAEHEDPEAMKVVATGGLCRLFAGQTGAIEITDLDLTLRGLLEVHRLNVAGHSAEPRNQDTQDRTIIHGR